MKSREMKFIIEDLEFTLSEKMIEEVMTEWQRANPLCRFDQLDSKTFADLCMKKIIASAQRLQTGTA